MDTTDTPLDMVEHRESICAAALENIEMGINCFPLSILDKRPLAKWKKYQTALMTEEDIEEWLNNGAPITNQESGEVVGHADSFNLAIVTGAISGILVVDCDNEQAVEYAKANGLTSPVSVKTRRGRHYYFKHPNNGKRYRNKVGSKPVDWHNCPGLDFRGDGGYVVAPPSVTVNPDGSLKHRYEWCIQSGLDFDDMPVWVGAPDDIQMNNDFDFASLSLENVPIGELATDIREQIQRRVDLLGRKLHGPDMGDATDDWMIRFCGQMVRRGLEGKELWDAIVQFHSHYFTYAKSSSELERWLKTKMRSAIEMDRRNHPEDYNAVTKERLKPSENQSAETPKTLIPIYSKDYQRLLKTLGDTVYYADPIIPARSIIQVVGYNGHGKSFFTGSLVTAIAANCPTFGPYSISRPARVFYMDFDNPARTVLNRFSGFSEMHGDPGDNLALWSPAIIPSDVGGSMNLRTKDGLDTLESWLDLISPEIVVIDTVRNAFGGLDEKNPQDWYHVNRVAKIIRDKYKASVVLVHHRNKPNEHGLGREAGSTAQLTDLDTQIVITQVYNDKATAKAKAGLFDGDISIERNSQAHTPSSYMAERLQRANMAQETRIRMMTEVSFGKVREETDLHKTTYIGWTENINSGEQGMIWLPSLREDAISLHKNGFQVSDIARKLYVPTAEINRWLGLK